MAFSLLQHSPLSHEGMTYGLSSSARPLHPLLFLSATQLRHGCQPPQPPRRVLTPYSRFDPLQQDLHSSPSTSLSSSSPSSLAPSAMEAGGVSSNIVAATPPSLAVMVAAAGCEEDRADGLALPMIRSPPSPLQLAESVASAVQLKEKTTVAAEVAESSLTRRQKRDSQRTSYLLAAIASSAGVTSLSVAAVYYRFAWQMQGGTVPVSEMFGTFALAFGAAVGMEYWARWAHKELWHNSLWSMHESHHRPREGPFELNDIFAIINAVPAIALIAYGFFHKGLFPGLCFGAGLGITVFGMAYMFVHDGLIHRRFPVGPIADVPFFQRVAVAHQLHHADKYQGVPFGIFLGPQELESVGGSEELEKLLEMRRKGIQATKGKSES